MTIAETGKAANAIDQTAHLFRQMEKPLRTVLEGLLRDFDGFSDLVAHHSEPGLGQFSGYEGIENRGEVGDILASEWAIHDLDPVEFMRRVAMQETLYRRRIHETETQGRAICLIVDSGAWMLGHNRLLGLGAVFWLAAQSAKQGVDFCWCHTADPGTWHQGLERRQIETYLSTVSQHELDQDMLEEIVTGLQPTEKVTREYWIVGPTRLEHRVNLLNLRAALLVDLPKTHESTNQVASVLRLWTKGTLKRVAQMHFPEDGLCIGALRRPFALDLSQSNVTRDYLLDNWAPRHWLELDNGKVAVRWRNGLLLTNHFSADKASDHWFPLPEDAQISAIFCEGSTFHLLWQSAEYQPHRLKYAVVNLTGNDHEPKVQEVPVHAKLDDFAFGTTALPWQDLGYDNRQDGALAVIDRLGQSRTINLKTGLVRHDAEQPTLLARDGSSQLWAVPVGDPRLGGEIVQSTAGHPYRNLTIRLEDPVNWTSNVRDIRLAISDIAVLMTEDGTRYVIRDRHEEIEMIWPDGLVPFQALGPKKGFGYNPSSGTIIQYRWHEGSKPQLHPKNHKGHKTGLSHLRSSRMGRFAYGVALDDGQPQELVRLRLGGKGPGFESISVVDLVAEARTVWLSD